MSPCTATSQAPSPSFSDTDRSPRNGLVLLMTLMKPKEMKEQKKIGLSLVRQERRACCSSLQPSLGMQAPTSVQGHGAPGSPAACTQTLLQAPSLASASLLQST